MQTQFTKNNLESPLVGYNTGLKEREPRDIFQDIGLDAAVTYSNMKKLNASILESCCISFNNIPMLLLPGTETKNLETFHRDIGKSIHRMVRDAELCVDMVLIDASSGENELSKKLMEIADLIVINLTQRRYVLEDLFTDYGELLQNNKKVFYLFGDYDDNSSYNMNNCRRKYSNFINNNNFGVVPYSTKYRDAQNESRITRFFTGGLKIREISESEKLLQFLKKIFVHGKYEQEEEEYFFNRSKLAVEKMFGLLNIPVRKEHREENQV